MFAGLAVEGVASNASSARATSEVKIIVGDVVIRAGAGADQGQLTEAIRATRGGIVMFGQDGPVKVFVAMRPIDFRKGIDGLALAVQKMLGLNPCCAALTPSLRWKRADRIRLLVRDQPGMVLFGDPLIEPFPDRDQNPERRRHRLGQAFVPSLDQSGKPTRIRRPLARTTSPNSARCRQSASIALRPPPEQAATRSLEDNGPPRLIRSLRLNTFFARSALIDRSRAAAGLHWPLAAG